jgi:hypothetical protein
VVSLTSSSGGYINGRNSARVISLLKEKCYFLELNQSETRIACGGHVC